MSEPGFFSSRWVDAPPHAREPFVELTEAVPGVRDVRDTNFCRIHARYD